MDEIKKEMKDILHYADVSYKWAFCISFSISIVLMVASFLVPPLGVIDGSVLAGVGELFGFPSLAAAVGCIRSGQKARLIHKDTTIEVNN